jgi:hypothetical protein
MTGRSSDILYSRSSFGLVSERSIQQAWNTIEMERKNSATMFLLLRVRTVHTVNTTDKSWDFFLLFDNTRHSFDQCLRLGSLEQEKTEAVQVDDQLPGSVSSGY